jgi:hypothetical protein
MLRPTRDHRGHPWRFSRWNRHAESGSALIAAIDLRYLALVLGPGGTIAPVMILRWVLLLRASGHCDRDRAMRRVSFT